MIAELGEIWLADGGDEVRRHVVVASSPRFHRLAERAVVAPIVELDPGPRPPWLVHVDGTRAAAVHLLGTVPILRLLERTGALDGVARAQLQRAVRAITS